MRCPKCGYISFDYVESCKKCRKNISEASAEIDGTVFAVSAPVFLDFEYEEAGGESERNEDDIISEENLGVGEEALDLSTEDDGFELGNEIAMDFEGDEGLDDFELVEEEGESSLELDSLEEVTEEVEDALEFGDKEEALESEDDGLQLDFGDIDISDLAPPEKDADELVTETLTLEEEGSPGALADGPPPVEAPVAHGSGLEDLQIEDLDLETPSPLVAGSKAGGKLMPSVKTGTALDNFEIDLGELTSQGK